jgi:hypothetical protein
LNMSGAAATIPAMGKKKQPPDGDRRPRGRPPTGRRPFVSLYLRVDPEISEAIDRYLAGKIPRTTTNAAIVQFIVRGLEAEGLWPPPPEE